MPVITTSTGAVHKCLPHLLRKGTPVCLFVFVFVFFRRCFLFFFSFCFSLFSLFLFSFVFFGFLSFVGCVCRACHIQYDGMYVVCVLHIKPFFLPVGIQHNQFRADTSILEERQVLRSQSCATEILLYVDMYAVSTVGDAMSCHHTG